MSTRTATESGSRASWSVPTDGSQAGEAAPRPAPPPSGTARTLTGTPYRYQCANAYDPSGACGLPVVVHGDFTPSGHIAVVVGYDADGFVVHDPSGRWDGALRGSYAGRTATNGRFVR